MDRSWISAALLLATIVQPHSLRAQSHPPAFTSLDSVVFDTSGPVLRDTTTPAKPFTVAGEHGVLVGQQNGVFESWVLPVKLISHLVIEADVEGYGVPIDVNQQSAEIEVRPDRTTITYSHPAFTVRQIMFSPAGAPAGTGPIVLFEFDCLHPTLFIFRFTPELKWMWPERNEGIPGAEWVSPDPHNSVAAGGHYVLHSDYPNLAAALTIPGAEPGIMAPYQERPQFHPLELKLHIDPVRDHGKLFPLLMAAGITSATATNAALAGTLARLNAQIPALYGAHAEFWKNLLARATSISTPDRTLNEAFQWAVISIEQLKTRTIPGQSSPPPTTIAPSQDTGLDAAVSVEQPGLASERSKQPATSAPEETALVAGYFTSADSARPGFGWFFGRDALYTLYAVNGYGDFALAKSELEFLIHRQRADGKIMHEYSQTAAAIDWQSFPYMYAAADSTPLFLLAVADYVRSSGDTAFLTAYRDAIEKVWAFETDPAHDTDHDGIYDNSQGTGWVESWPGGMPHQEIYLALLDQQASSAMAWIERQLNDSIKAAAAQHRADAIARTINTEYYDAKKSCYAFSHNADGTNDRTTTVYPALAWWDPASNKAVPAKPILDHPDECLRQFAASALNTDWGLRDVANTEKIYDGLSYHQGSVWPLFTGWSALAEYRGNQPLAGYQLLMENANLTRAQDLGAVTELLSGDFCAPFGRSTSHQLWSSAMVITPTLRGLFGISIDAQSKTITVNPHLPAGWTHAEILDLQLPATTAALYFKRNGGELEVSTNLNDEDGWRLRSDQVGATFGPIDKQAAKKIGTRPDSGLRIPLPAVEVDQFDKNANLIEPAKMASPNYPPIPGARTSKFRVVHAEYGDHKLILSIEGAADTEGILSVYHHRNVIPKVAQEPAAEASLSFRSCDANPYACKCWPLTFHFPLGAGFQTITVTLTW